MFTTFTGKRNAAFAVAAFLSLTAAAVSAPGSVKAVPRAMSPAVTHGLRPAIAPQGSDCSTGTTAPFYCVGAENDSTVNGFNYGVYGLEGYAPNSTGGVGVLGYSGKSTVSGAYGVYGVTFATNGIGVYGAGDGPAPASGATPSSTQQSTGVVGSSASGDGVYGSTQFPNDSNTGQVAGVIGADVSTSGDFNDGVVGTTMNGGYGVVGIGSSANGEDSIGGVYGTDAYGDGVSGYGTAGIVGYSNASATPEPTSAPYTSAGSYGQSGYGPGVYGVDVHDTGTPTGVTATFNRFAGVYGFGNDGAGVFGYSYSDIGVFAQNDSSNNPPLLVNSENSSNYYEILAGTGTVTNNSFNFAVETNGNVIVGGTVTASNGSFARTRNPGANTTTYATQETEATVEDIGSAQLVGGTAAISIAPDFRKTIDSTSPYMVFLTPYGDNHGLYIATRTAAGFTVRESQGGRSTLSFDYRIVARPYGSRQSRLPLVETTRLATGISRGGGQRQIALKGAGGRPLGSSDAPATSARDQAKRATFQRSLESRTQLSSFVPRPNSTIEFRLH